MQWQETPRVQTSFTGRVARRGPRLAAAGLFLLACLLAGVARANNTVDWQAIGAGTLLFESGEEMVPAPGVTTDAEISVSGIVARAKVSQTFRNDSSEWVNGLYVFPLPETAAVDRLRMRIGSREIIGEVRERAAARKTFEKARDSGHKASLIEQERPNVFTNSVANIGPGETVVIEIEYQQRVDYDNGTFSLRFPMAITPRYAPPAAADAAAAAVSGADGAVPPAGACDCGSASVTVSLDAGLPLAQVESSYHEIDQLPVGTRVEVTLSDGRVAMDRDFQLTWRPLAGSEPEAVAFTESLAGERYALLMFMPPQMSQASALPRELIIVVDRSGSMAGPSIRQARAALDKALGRLTLRDRFNVIAFSSRARALFPEPQPADELALATAYEFIASLDASGGTNMRDALALALDENGDRRASADGFLRQVVFITDGAVTNEEELFGMLETRLGDSRLFTVGIGGAPNGYFMRRAAAFGRGTYTHVGDMREVEENMDVLMTKLEHPALTGLEVAWPEGVLIESGAARVPDLYAGEPVVLTARLRGSADAVTLRGGSGWNRRIAFSASESPGIATLFARERVAELMDERVRGRDTDAIDRNITAIALKHQIVSRFTSLVAVDRTPARPVGINAALTPAQMALPVAMAAMPMGSTNAPAFILIGALFILVPLLLTYGWRE